MVSALPKLRCRQIEQADIAAVAELFIRGFTNRSRQFWYHALDQLTRREPPRDLPKYGYLLETNGVTVGAILLICSEMRTGAAVTPRCNLSSWYVDPPYRVYAPLLVSHALRHKDVTYLNVSAAPHTWPIIEAQGFSRYSEGIFISVPALSRMSGEREGRGIRRGQRRRRPSSSLRAGHPAAACRAWLHQPVVRDAPSALIRSFFARAWSRASYPARN